MGEQELQAIMQSWAEENGPLDAYDFIQGGGMRPIEARAVAEERRRWLPRLGGWLAEEMADPDGDRMTCAILQGYIRQLRIHLGIKAPVDIERRREQTRERVRRHRAAHKEIEAP